MQSVDLVVFALNVLYDETASFIDAHATANDYAREKNRDLVSSSELPVVHVAICFASMKLKEPWRRIPYHEQIQTSNVFKEKYADWEAQIPLSSSSTNPS